MQLASKCSVDEAIAGLFTTDSMLWSISTFTDLGCEWTEPQLDISDFLPISNTIPSQEFPKELHFDPDAIRWKLPAGDEVNDFKQGNDMVEEAVSCRPSYLSALCESSPIAFSFDATLHQDPNGKSEVFLKRAEGSSSPRATSPGKKEKKRLIAWTKEEHKRFVAGLEQLRTERTEAIGPDGKKTVGLGPGVAEALSAMVGTRSAAQVRSHAQKHFLRERRLQRWREQNAGET